MSPSEKENFQRLLKKYVRNESTEIELEELFNYIKLQNHPNDILDVTEVLKNVKEFPEMDPEGRDRILKSILQTPQIKVTARNPKRNYWKYAVAAIFIGSLYGIIPQINFWCCLLVNLLHFKYLMKKLFSHNQME